MAKTAKTRATEAAERKLAHFYSDTFPSFLEGIRNCKSGVDQFKIRSLVERLEKVIRMAHESGVDFSLHGMRFDRSSVYTNLVWFLYGTYVVEMVNKLNKARPSYSIEVERIKIGDAFDREEQVQFYQAKEDIRAELDKAEVRAKFMKTL